MNYWKQKRRFSSCKKRTGNYVELLGLFRLVAIEDAKVVKRELEKKIIALTEQCATKDGEILHLHQANGTLQWEVAQYKNEFAVLMGAAITSSISAAVYEEKALKLIMEGKASEISAIALKEVLMEEMHLRDAHIEP
jgi:hypothetical protein